MKHLLAILALLLWTTIASAQQTTFWPNCSGLDDTARFTTIITNVGANTATIRLPFKNGTRCAVGTLTIPDNVTLDNSDGTGIRVITGQILTVVGPVVSPVGKPMFFGPGTTLFTGNTHIGANGQALVSDGLGGTSWATIVGGGGGGAVNTVFGRSGDVVAVTNDYTWAQINKATSSLADITLRSADLLSNGVTGTGQIALHDTPTFVTPVLGAATATSINGLAISASGSTLAVAAGKTLTVNNTLTLAGSADGFTFTVPATGTAVLTSRTITEGAGLAGNTYDLSANRTLQLGTPSTLSVTSLTSVSGTTHSHAITSSANPGAAQSLLATDASGHLQLFRLGIATAPTQPLEVNGNVFISSATANLFLKDTSTGLQAASTLVITPQANNCFRSTDYTSGLVGWNICAAGDAEFGNVNVRGEIRSSVFKVNEIAATAGTFGVFFSASNLSADAVIPASGSFTFNAKNSDAGGMLFSVGDIVRFKGLSTTGVTDTWATITARTNNGSTATYTATLSSGSASTTYTDGTAVVDYGPSGTGFITLSADGTVGATPNLTMATHAGSPWSAFTTLIRAGNLNGSYGYAANTYGFAAGQYGVAGQSWTTVDSTNGVRIGNNTTPVIWLKADGSGYVANTSFSWDTAGNVNIAGNAVIAGWAINSNRISSGTTHLASAFDVPAGQVAWFGKTTGTTQGWFLRDGSGRFVTGLVGSTAPTLPFIAANDGTNYRVVMGGLNDTFNGGASVNSMGFKIWDSSGNLLVQFHDLANTIASWTISTSRISAGSGATTVGMDATVTGGDDVRFFAGDGTPSSAPFRVTESGALTASNANITGAITATSGSFTGAITASSGSITGPLTVSGASGSLAFGVTPPTSASSGTGLWIDRTGLYGLASSVVQAKIDATTGAFVAGAGDITIDANGIRIEEGAGNPNTLRWVTAAFPNTTYAQVFARKASSTIDWMVAEVSAESGANTNITDLSLRANNSSVHEATLVLRKHGVSHATNPDAGWAMFAVSGGVSIVREPFPSTFNAPAASAALDVQSTTGAVIFPRMTTTQKNALTPTAGMVVFDTSLAKLQVYDGSAWTSLH